MMVTAYSGALLDHFANAETALCYVEYKHYVMLSTITKFVEIQRTRTLVHTQNTE